MKEQHKGVLLSIAHSFHKNKNHINFFWRIWRHFSHHLRISHYTVYELTTDCIRVLIKIDHFCSCCCCCLTTVIINLTIKCRWTPMESSPSGSHSPALSLAHSHFSVLHWLLLTGKTLTYVGVETFSTDKHLIFPWYKEFETNFRTYFHLLMTSLLPGFSLQPGTGYLDVFRDLVWYVCV